MKALWQLYLANVKEFVRDRMAMFWTLAFPIFFIVIFGIIFSGTSGTTFDVGLAVEDNGPTATALQQAFRSVQAFKLAEGKRDELLAQLKNGKLRALIVIPAGVSQAVSTGQPARVETYYDPSSQTTAQIVLTIVGKVVDGVDQGLTQRPTLLLVDPQPITANNLGEIDLLLPGILAMSLMQLGLFATAPALVQLREQQVLRRIGATPLPRVTLLAAQVLHRLTIGGVQTFLILLIGIIAFKVNIVGNLGLLLGFVLLGALMFVALGYLISGLARTQDSVTGITQVLNFPMMFLSGIFFPIDLIPAWIRPVVAILPLTYLADALRQIMVGATPAYSLPLDFGILLGWLLVCGLLAVRFFKWE
jgi:ABC-2 type transport system permease protein